MVEYEEVAALKQQALRLIFEAESPSACARLDREEGELLRVFALWQALDQHLHTADPNLWIWPDWPAAVSRSSERSRGQFAASHENEIRFYSWIQWLIDQQIGEVQQHARATGMSIGLYHDLALATDRAAPISGPIAISTSRAPTGAPPDDFSPTGQDWSFPPPNSRRHREDAYRLYVASIRKALRHGGALRIDHVMRLFRLYWIPEGHNATHGAYVRDRPRN